MPEKSKKLQQPIRKFRRSEPQPVYVPPTINPPPRAAVEEDHPGRQLDATTERTPARK